jgi:surfactin synthase thioesterase subunit
MTRQEALRSASSLGWLVRITRSATDASRRIFCFGPNPSDAEFVATLGIGGMDPAILAEPEPMEIVLLSLRAALEVSSSEQVSCPIAVMAGQIDTLSIADLVALRGLTNSSFGLRLVPGGHFSTKSESVAVAQAAAAELPLVLERVH